MKAVQQKWFVIVAMTFMLCLTGMIISGTAFADRCVNNGDGTITDNGTGLMWQKATAGPMTWETAISYYASGLSLGGHSGWGLPNIHDLEVLYHSPCKDMMDVQDYYYWSSTTYDFVTNHAWRVGFQTGRVGNGSKSYSYFVRAVRAGQ